MNSNTIIDTYKQKTTEELSLMAREVCESKYGPKVYIRGLVEFSNHCLMDCLYCGIRKSNGQVERYRLTEEQIIQTVFTGYERGVKTFVLQSGEDSYFSLDVLAGIVEAIKNKTGDDAAITLSCGIRSKDDYRTLKQAGADRYLIRFETSDEKLHSYIRNGISLKRRLKALEDLSACGFELGSGYMVGLPGETEEIRIQNALLCKEMGLDMIGIGPFIPHPETPLKEADQQDFELTIRAVALVRLLLPGANIPATTAAGSVDPLGREKLLAAGANVLMPNITPTEVKKHYLLYPGKICLDESGFQCIGCLTGRVSSVNKEMSMERGDSLRFIRKVEEQLA